MCLNRGSVRSGLPIWSAGVGWRFDAGWGARGGGEVDLLIFEHGRRVEMKFSEAPEVTRSMHNIIDILRLDHLFVVCPSRASYPVHERISVLSVFDCADLVERIESA